MSIAVDLKPLGGLARAGGCLSPSRRMKAGALRELALLCREIGRGQGRFGVCLESSVREQEEFGTILGSIPALTDVDALPWEAGGKTDLANAVLLC